MLCCQVYQGVLVLNRIKKNCQVKIFNYSQQFKFVKMTNSFMGIPQSWCFVQPIGGISAVIRIDGMPLSTVLYAVGRNETNQSKPGILAREQLISAWTMCCEIFAVRNLYHILKSDNVESHLNKCKIWPETKVLVNDANSRMTNDLCFRKCWHAATIHVYVYFAPSWP